MAKPKSKQQENFLAKVQAHRKEKVENLAYAALGLSLKANLPVFDLPYYVLQRTREVIENSFKTVNFQNPELQKARTAFLKECLKQMKSNVVFNDPKEVVDETDERDNRCEPIVKEMTHLILNEDLIFSDMDYFNLILADEESVPLSAAIAGYENALDEKMTMIISEHWSRASKAFWGVEKEAVTMEMLNVVLKGEKLNVETPKE